VASLSQESGRKARARVHNLFFSVLRTLSGCNGVNEENEGIIVGRGGETCTDVRIA
jgi:hypothetical protein